MRMLVIILLITSYVVSERMQYNGYQLVRLTPYTDIQVQMLRLQLSHRTSSEMDFWTAPRKVKSPVYVLMGPEVVRKPTNWFYDIPMDVITTDIQSDIDKILKEFDSKDKNAALDLNSFNTLNQIEKWMDEQAAHCEKTHEHHCSVEVIGQTHEGRPLKVFHIKKGGQGVERKGYWVDATIHGRDWLATATIIKVVDNMLNNYGKDASVTRLVDEYDWHFMPVINPDGYAYTYHVDGDRLWRKNRRPVNNTDCIGTDLNRNFAWKWNAESVSRGPCSATYRGPSEASEPETKAIQQKVAEVAPMVNAWISIHGSGNLVTFPWGATVDQDGKECEFAEDHERMVAWATADAIMTRHGTTWEWGSSCDILYNTSGSLDDYLKGAYGVDMAFTVALRGENFTPPVSVIQPSFEEFWRGLETLVDSTSQKNAHCP